MGDRALLRKRCRESDQSKSVRAEVRRIMGPSSSQGPGLGYSTSSSSLVGLINRKPKRKAKFELSKSTKKGRVSTARFQKKLVVLKYMGLDAMEKFTRADKRIALRGLLPPIPLESTEDEVRREICELIRSSSDFAECDINDFEFIDMNGKQASVPKCKAGFEWNGRAVKELAGSGCLYVRFTKFVGDASSGDSDSDLPQITVQSPKSDQKVIVVPDDPSPVHASQLPASSDHPSTSGSTSHPDVNFESPFESSSESQSPIGSPALKIIHENKVDPKEEIDKLAEMFPNVADDQLKYVYHLPKKRRFDRTVECLVEGPSLEALRSLAATQLVIPFSESPCIRIDVDADEEEMVGAALAYYKHGRFNKEASVRVSMRRQPGVDTGGVRRQFFSMMFGDIALSKSIQTFEGPIHRLRPSYRASNLSSGLLTTIGTMVGHSFLLDGYGFPYLSECCYYYIAGCSNKALTCITTEDVEEQVRVLIQEVEAIASDEDVKQFKYMPDLSEVMDKSGCDVRLTVSNKKAIVECIMVYDALQKRSAYLDAFANGLDVFGLKRLISLFPEVCKAAFVWDGKVRPLQVASMMNPTPTIESMDPNQKRVWGYLMKFVDSAEEADLKAYIQYVTGCPVPVGNIVVSFTQHPDSEAVSANTCGRQIVLSSLIQEEYLFIPAMLAIIPGHRYTMP